MATKRVLFSGYAPVHFICFLPVYQRLNSDPELEVFLSGGFKEVDEAGNVSYRLDGFYEPYIVDRARLLTVEESRSQAFDVVVCAHTSDLLFPREVGKTVQIFHGVSFKNLAVRDKALRYDMLCLPGEYHVERYRQQGLLEDPGTRYLLTGFPKSDALIHGDFDRAEFFRRVELNPDRPTLLLAPTGDKHNALEEMGREVIEAIDQTGEYNLLVKPHDHPKKSINWIAKLAGYENHRVRIIRDKDITESLLAADLLMTDASSVAVEYTLLDRPIVFLDVPRLLERIRERAPALDLETYGRKIGALAKSADEVVSVVKRSLENPDQQGELRRRMASHVFHRPGGAADRIARVIRYAAGLTRTLPSDIPEFGPAAANCG